jgi:hypothetical protein
MEYVNKHNEYRSDLSEKLHLLNDTRIRWLDGMGVSKEMRLHGEWGEKHIAQSQHFHRFCNESYMDVNLSMKSMNVCSNITELLAHLLLGHAVGPKQPLSKSTHNFLPAESSFDLTLRYCHACPKRLLPFHITPRPKMTCEHGPFHERTDTDELAAVCKPTLPDQDICPESCMQNEVSWQFESQSDVVNVRECPVHNSKSMLNESMPNEPTIPELEKGALDNVVNEEQQIPSWMRSNLADVSNIKCEESDTLFYWNIPETGGTTIQNLYWCLGLTIANEIGAIPKFGHGEKSKLVKFLPFHGKEWAVVNVDTSTEEGILRAKNLQLASSTNPSVDLVVSGHLRLVAKELFDPDHKGKVFAMFRHPVDRELLRHKNRQDYSSQLTNMTIDNWMVRNLVGKEDPKQDVTNEDLKIAKEIVRTKIIVGLESRFVKSFDRFNDFLGIKIYKRWTRGKCIREFVHKNDIDEATDVDSSQLKAISDRNLFDLLLYEYAEGLFNEQEIMSNEIKAEDLS